MNEARIAELNAKVRKTAAEQVELDRLNALNLGQFDHGARAEPVPADALDFTVSGTRGDALAQVASNGYVLANRPHKLVDAVHGVVAAVADDDRDVKVEVKGNLAGVDRTVTITVTSVERPVPELKTPLTAKEEADGLAAKRLNYQDAGRHVRNDKGEVTDVNALPVGGR